MIEPSSISGAITPVPAMSAMSGSSVPNAKPDSVLLAASLSTPTSSRMQMATASRTAGSANNKNPRRRPSSPPSVSLKTVPSTGTRRLVAAEGRVGL